ncbi:helix-turn-helix domain-containing protein [Flavobacterium sp. J372]|uniref:helix-turn-helix domain-containing protein n=1 Tax=Flavobacterium sp. J372 TaxID=2898436 RepID=UPI002150D4F7|nr:helix-turn-helix domain-containing protein [Flavobacterium sp. J372]MCR5862701.1 helix-turn-helix domain-containing protein [Flavobacterium sp. J372]
MNIDLVTKDDLQKFKEELLEEIRHFQMYPRKRGEEPKAWLKSYEVRKLLGISAGTLQNLRVNGTLPFSKIGGLMYYRYDDIQKLMEKVR